MALCDVIHTITWITSHEAVQFSLHNQLGAHTIMLVFANQVTIYVIQRCVSTKIYDIIIIRSTCS